MDQEEAEIAEWNSPTEVEKAPQGLISGRGIVESAGARNSAQWNSLAEVEKAPQGLVSAPENKST